MLDLTPLPLSPWWRRLAPCLFQVTRYSTQDSKHFRPFHQRPTHCMFNLNILLLQRLYIQQYRRPLFCRTMRQHIQWLTPNSTNLLLWSCFHPWWLFLWLQLPPCSCSLRLWDSILCLCSWFLTIHLLPWWTPIFWTAVSLFFFDVSITYNYFKVILWMSWSGAVW